MTGKTFNNVLKMAAIALIVTAFFYSNLFDMFLRAAAAIVAVVLMAFVLHWFVRGERPHWKLSKKSK